jgi:hypothetical protein
VFWREEIPIGNLAALENGTFVEKFSTDADFPFFVGTLPAGNYFLWAGNVTPAPSTEQESDPEQPADPPLPYSNQTQDEPMAVLAVFDSEGELRAIHADVLFGGIQDLAGVDLLPPFSDTGLPLKGFIDPDQFLNAFTCFGTLGTIGTISGCFGTFGTFGCDFGTRRVIE